AILPLFLPFPPPPISTLFPYTTLFRSLLLIHVVRLADLGEHHAREIRSVRAFVLLSESFDEQAELIASEAADNGFARQYARETLDRKSTRLNSSHVKISYAVFCLKKKR